MERFMRNDSDFQLLFNCSFYEVSDITVEQRRDYVYGPILVILSFIYLLLYLPCTVSIWRRSHDNTCYILMFVMSILDIFLLVIFTIVGWLQVLGDVYCSHPKLNYVISKSFFALWITETSIEFILALNRCINFISPRISEILFGSCEKRDRTSWRTWLWTLPPITLGMGKFLYSSSFYWNSKFNGFAINPHYGYADEMEPMFLTNHDYDFWIIYHIVYAFALPSVYLIFLMALIVQIQEIGGTSGNSSERRQRYLSQKTIFIQVFLIASFNSSAAICTSMAVFFVEFSRYNKYIDIIINLLLIQSSGIPPVIYLFLNRTIRRDCREMFLRLMAIDPNHNQEPQQPRQK